MSFCQRLNIRYPIFLAPMAGVSTPQLAACVSNAGGLGSLGLGASNPKAALEAITQTQKLTDSPFQVNFFCHQSTSLNPQQAQAWIDYIRPYFQAFQTEPPQTLNKIYKSFNEDDELLDVVLQTKPKAVSFHFGLPTPAQMQALKAANIMTMASVTQYSEAVLAVEAGIDVLIAQGIEAGGHRGTFNPQCDAGISTHDLVTILTKHFELPIVAAGGIMSGDDINHYLQQGAAAAQLGTAFVQCSESAASAAYKQALLQQATAHKSITQITDSISGRPARGLLNHWQQKIDFANRPSHAGYPYSYDLAKQLNAIALKHGDDGFAAYWAGSNVHKIRELDASALMSKLIEEISNPH